MKGPNSIAREAKHRLAALHLAKRTDADHLAETDVFVARPRKQIAEEARAQHAWHSLERGGIEVTLG